MVAKLGIAVLVITLKVSSAGVHNHKPNGPVFGRLSVDALSNFFARYRRRAGQKSKLNLSGSTAMSSHSLIQRMRTSSRVLASEEQHLCLLNFAIVYRQAQSDVRGE